MNIDAYTMDNEGRAYIRSLPTDDLKDVLLELSDEVCDIEGQLADRGTSDSVWSKKAEAALIYRRRIQRFMERVIAARERDKGEPREVLFMAAAQKLLDPQTFNTILLAASKTARTEI